LAVSAEALGAADTVALVADADTVALVGTADTVRWLVGADTVAAAETEACSPIIVEDKSGSVNTHKVDSTSDKTGCTCCRD